MAVNWKNIADIGGDIWGLYNANKTQQASKDIIKNADPFGPERQQYADQLRTLMNNPDSIKDTPGYQFQFEGGADAVQRKLASSGFHGSGNEAAALTEYGQNFATSFRDKELNRLATLAGAGISPTSGAAGLSGMNSAFEQASAVLASLGYSKTKTGTTPQETLTSIAGLFDPKKLSTGISSLLGAGGAGIGSDAALAASLAPVGGETAAIAGAGGAGGAGAAAAGGASSSVMAAAPWAAAAFGLAKVSEKFVGDYDHNFKSPDQLDNYDAANRTGTAGQLSATMSQRSGMQAGAFTWANPDGTQIQINGSSGRGAVRAEEAYKQLKKKGAILPTYDEFKASYDRLKSAAGGEWV